MLKEIKRINIIKPFNLCFNMHGIQVQLIVLSHWPHVAQQVQQQVAELVSENVAGTVHTGHKLSNKLRHIFVLMTSSVRCCYAPRRLVAAHVASVKGLGHKLSNKFGNLCPSPFTLATCAATSLRGA